MYKFSIKINVPHDTMEVFDEYEADNFDVGESGDLRFYKEEAVTGGVARHTSRIYAAGYWLMLDYIDDKENPETEA